MHTVDKKCVVFVSSNSPIVDTKMYICTRDFTLVCCFRFLSQLCIDKKIDVVVFFLMCSHKIVLYGYPLVAAGLQVF